MVKANSEKKRKYHIGLIIFLVLLLAMLVILGMNVRRFSSRQLNPVVETSKKVSRSSTLKEQNDEIVGSYRDDKDGAAIVFNENGTGRYVYADRNNPDTDDKLTWKKQGDSYLVTLQDKNVINPLVAKMEGKQLVITGNGGWNTETFNQLSESLNLDEFLRQAHGK